MADYEIVGTPFAQAATISLSQGDLKKQETVYTIPDNQLLIIECIGINSFLQPQQEILTAIMPVLDGGLTVYPVPVIGTLDSPDDPQFPFRRFGGQQLVLYANERVDITVVRNSADGEALIEFNISGRLLEPV